MKRVGPEDIIVINEAYLAAGTYSGAAAATGWSASTIKKYVIPNYQSKPKVENTIVKLPSIDVAIDAMSGKNITCLRPDEEEELKKLWKEMLV